MKIIAPGIIEWQPVPYPAILAKMEERQMAVSPLLGLISVAYSDGRLG